MCVNECSMSWLLGRQELLAILPLGVVWSTRITDGSLAACWASSFLPKQHCPFSQSQSHFIYLATPEYKFHPLRRNMISFTKLSCHSIT